MAERRLSAGDPAPLFVARSTNNERFQFHTTAGRTVVLTFVESASRPDVQALLDGIVAGREAFDDRSACFFGVSVDPDDERERRLTQLLPGIRYFWDADRAVSRLYGMDERPYRQGTVVLDERLRVVASRRFEEAPQAHLDWLWAVLQRQARQPFDQPAPVLVVPRVFEPELWAAVVEHHHDDRGQPSRSMREIDGRTVVVHDRQQKRRRDVPITDRALLESCRDRLARRLFPQIHAAFQFQPTRIERYIVAAYDAGEGGWFKTHRDNTSAGTAHRRFAVTLDLDTGAYEGGALSFPEFGARRYVAPPGGAVVFSCSLLHEAHPVTRGRRYVFLPFLFDEAGEKVRRSNLHLLDLGGEEAMVDAPRATASRRTAPRRAGGPARTAVDAEPGEAGRRPASGDGRARDRGRPGSGQRKAGLGTEEDRFRSWRPIAARSRSPRSRGGPVDTVAVPV
jgi:predicted 2-oxoglutarate/Fe(II)-dependent dioxygenase YbiX/peroxiredoxin